ncbi:hypothetical protein ACQPYK_30360 [Streptosporangium sp. CA-135522]|uniref:hypothetical protein n=1 Tax=Streptosporangium sp. CA-135522 TaxID=3240072 RepID=UPI003D8CB24F
MAAPPLKITRADRPDTPLPLSQATNTHYQGDYRGALIDVGHADAADLAGKDLRGAIVLLHPTIFSDGENPPPGSSVTERMTVLKKAGAALALVIQSTQRYWSWGEGLWNADALPVAVIDESAGEALAKEIATHPVRIRATGTVSSPYAYYTTNGPRKSIPAQQQVVRQQQFATVQADYHQGPAADGYACRYAHFIEPGYPYAYGGYFPSCTLIGYPASRTEFLQDNGARWQFRAPATAPNLARETFYQNEGVLKAGQRLTEAPFKAPLLPCAAPLEPPLAPGLTTYTAGRTGDQITMSLTNLCGPKLDSFVFSDWEDHLNVALYLDGEQIGTDGNAGVDSADHVYRLVAEVDRDAAGLSKTSTHSKTEWTFHSAHTDEESALPLPQIGIDLPLGPDNYALRSQRQVVRLLPGHQQGAKDVPFTSVTASYSTDDGTTWHDVPVRHGNDDWEATIQPGVDNGFVSLRVSGTDKSGNSVTETVTRAYGLTGSKTDQR